MRGETSNRNPRDGLAGGGAQTKIVDLTGEFSNQVLDVLMEWEEVLKHASLGNEDPLDFDV